MTCNEWYLIDVDKNISKKEREFIGYNDGLD